MAKRITIKEATEILFENTCMELIDDVYQTPDYVEFRGTCGGDALRFRVYNDGKVYEK